jgi:hypothetical protein
MLFIFFKLIRNRQVHSLALQEKLFIQHYIKMYYKYYVET